MTTRSFCMLAAAIFALIALLQLLRIFMEWSVTLNGELSPKFGDVWNRKGGISWGCLTPPLLHRRSDMPCPTITSPG